MALGTEVGDAYISIHADTVPFRADLLKLNRALNNVTRGNDNFVASLKRVNKAVSDHTKISEKDRKALRGLGDDADHTGRRLDASRGIFEKFADNVHDRWRRMDTTVRLVLTLILAAGPQMAALGSVLSSSLLGVAAAAAGAVIALSPLVGLFAPFAYGVGLAVAGLKDLENFSPGAASALQELKSAFLDVDLPAFMREWTPALKDFFSTLADSLTFDTVAENLGKAFGRITEAFTAVLNSDAWVAFTDAIEGPLSDALATFGEGFAKVFEALLTFIAATAPVALQLADMFKQWATGIADFFAEAAASGELQAFFESLLPTLQAVLDFFGAVKDVLVGLFDAAIGPGTAFIEILTGIVGKFAEWLNSTEGQNRMSEFFANLFAILPSLLEFIGATAAAISDLVTPEAVEATIGLLDALSQIMPILSDVIALLAEAGVIDVLAAALIALGEIVTPLIGPLGDFLSILSGEIISILETLAPEFGLLGENLGILFTAITPILPVLGELITAIASGLAPVFAKAIPMIAELIGRLAPIITSVADAILPLIPVIADLAIQLLDALWPAFEALIPAVLSIVEALAPFISQLVEMLAPVLVPIVDAIVQLTTVLLDALMPVFEALLPILLIVIETALVPLMLAFELLMPLVVSLIDIALIPLQAIFEVLTPILEFFSEAITWAMDNAITPLISTIGDWIDKNTFVKDAVQGVIDKVKAFATKIGDAKDAVVDFVGGMWDKIKGFKDDVIGVFEGIGDAIENAFKSAFNFVADAWNNTVGKLEFTIPSWVPSVGGNKWAVPDIPKFASGGIVNSPTFGVFGDAGTEMLVPVDRPLSQVDPAVRDVAAFAQGKAGSTNNVTINTAASDPRIIAGILEDVFLDGWR